MNATSRSVRAIRTARVQILSCFCFAAIWVLLIRWHIAAGNLGGAMIFVFASLLLIPIATALALIATAKLLAARSSSGGRRKLLDTAFLVAGVILSASGVATCVRIVYGIMTGG